LGTLRLDVRDARGNITITLNELNSQVRDADGRPVELRLGDAVSIRIEGK